MTKLIVGILFVGLVVTGCADQSLQTAQLSAIFGPKLAEPAPPPLPAASPLAVRKNRAVRLAAVRKRPRKQPKAATVSATAKAPAVAKPRDGLDKPVALDGADAACKSRLAKLPTDADRRSSTLRVQCFFIGRGEYLTSDGKVKSL